MWLDMPDDECSGCLCLEDGSIFCPGADARAVQKVQRRRVYSFQQKPQVVRRNDACSYITAQSSAFSIRSSDMDGWLATASLRKTDQTYPNMTPFGGTPFKTKQRRIGFWWEGVPPSALQSPQSRAGLGALAPASPVWALGETMVRWYAVVCCLYRLKRAGQGGWVQIQAE